MNTHRGLCNHMTWMHKYSCLGTTDRILLKSPISFDGFGFEFFAPLNAGAALVLAAPGRNWDVGYLLQVIRDYAVTTMLIVPSFLRVMADDLRFNTCSQLRMLFVGGEAVPAELIRRVKKQISVPLVNFYGPAEASIDTVAWKYLGNEIPEQTLIGLPVSNTQAYILNDRQQ